MRDILENILSNFRWYRRLRGGRWEKWYVGYPVCASLWFHDSWYDLARCDGRPLWLCRCGAEKIEWYSLAKEIEELTTAHAKERKF